MAVYSNDGKEVPGLEENSGFDMEEYINRRMLEISSLEDRVLYREIVGDVLLKLYHYNQKSYERLEGRIQGEVRPEQGSYAVYLTMTDREHYDATDEFMYPMAEEDVRKTEVSYQDIREALAEKRKLRLYSVFLATSASNVYRILHENREFHGTIRTKNREYKGTFTVGRNEKYLNMVKELYYIFAINYQPWITVCEAYLTKILDVYLCSAESLPEKDDIEEIRVDFEEYSESARNGMIPLWNLKKIHEKTSTYPEPGIDKINYEHQIFSHRLNADCEYLVMNTDVEITNIRRMKGDLLISCPADRPCDWSLYQVNKCKDRRRYLYPVLSNCFKESFSGSITEMYRRSIKTKAEMARLIESFPYGEYVHFMGMEIGEELPKGWESSNYNMDGFIQDEIRIGHSKLVLTLFFAPVDRENYLNEDIMSFLVTQVQKLFPEYMCVGSMVRGFGEV